VAGSCEYGDKPSNSRICRNFLSSVVSSQEGLCSMELVRAGYGNGLI
jgi:hypothetical protein